MRIASNTATESASTGVGTNAADVAPESATNTSSDRTKASVPAGGRAGLPAASSTRTSKWMMLLASALSGFGAKKVRFAALEAMRGHAAASSANVVSVMRRLT